MLIRSGSKVFSRSRKIADRNYVRWNMPKAYTTCERAFRSLSHKVEVAGKLEREELQLEYLQSTSWDPCFVINRNDLLGLVDGVLAFAAARRVVRL